MLSAKGSGTQIEPPVIPPVDPPPPPAGSPTITSFTPASGLAGATVVITGTNFTGVTAVRFNGINAGSYTVNSATQITATVPTGTSTGRITVLTGVGTATSGSNFTLTTPAPTISGFSPSSGNPTTSVVITGTNFAGASAVRFGGVNAASYTINGGGTQITATVPTGAVSGAITVVTPNGTATSSGSFTYVPPSPPPVNSIPVWQFGIACRPQTGDAAKAAGCNADIARVEFVHGTAATAMDSFFTAYWNQGIRVQLLISVDDQHNVLISTAECNLFATYSARFGPGGTFWTGKANPLPIFLIEFGNESSYGYKATDDPPNYTGYKANAAYYAGKCVTAANSLASDGKGVGLIIQMDESNGFPWVDGLYGAVPNLNTYAAGWSNHPYGPTGNDKVIRVSSQCAAKGWGTTIKFHFTEWGLATDNGRDLGNNYEFASNMTYSSAASTLNAQVAAYRAYWGTRLRQWMWYDIQDEKAAGTGGGGDRESYFGAITQGGSDKGPLTPAIRAQCAST